MTLRSFATDWLTRIAHTVRPATRANYTWAITHHLVPLLGDHDLAAITRQDIRHAADALRTRLAPRSQRLVLTVLRTMLSAAVEDELIPVNPARNPGKVLGRSVLATRPALLGGHVQATLRAAETVAPHMVPLFLFLARTGCRVGEALGLEWEHVDLDARVALICQQAWGGGRVGPTKNGRSHYIDLSAQLVLTLRAHRRTTVGPWVFPGATGHPYVRATVHHWFRRCLSAAGLEGRGLTLHSLRHGFASTLLSRGEPLAYVSRALDHSDPRLTVNLYGAHLPNRRLTAVDGLDD